MAAKLTGTSQLVALICAPIFGFAHRSRQHHVPLCCAAIAGIFGCCGFALIKVPDPSREGGTLLIFLPIFLLGISQIGTIVCSLGLLGQCIYESEKLDIQCSHSSSCREEISAEPSDSLGRDDQQQNDETFPLVGRRGSRTRNLKEIKGSLAGTYSLSGGFGILILTKLGGFFFDTLSPASPFVILAIFNTLLLCGILFCIGMQLLENQRKKM